MRKFFALFFCVILVFPVLLAAQSTISVISWALDRQFYIDALAHPQVLQTLIAGPMIDQIIHNQTGLPSGLDTSELETVVKSILTPEYLQDQSEDFINAGFDYLQGKTNELNLTIDVSPIKEAIEGEQQDDFLYALVESLPVCETNQVPGIGGDGQSACKPSLVTDEFIVEDVFKPALPGILSTLPDEIPIEDEWLDLEEVDRWRTLIPGMAVPASIILSLITLALIAICLWYFTALIADATWRVRLQWLGWMLLVPSALVFLLGFATQSGVPAYWIRYGLDQADLSQTMLGPELNVALQTVIMAALPRVAQAFQAVGGICGAFAVALIFWGIAIPHRRTEDI